MNLHYNKDGSIKVIINFKGRKLKMIFENEEDYKEFLGVIF